MKVLTIVGTRPEIIRLSRVVTRLEDETNHKLVHTGQNWDPLLSDVFFDELGLRKPDHFLNVDTSSLGTVLGGVMSGIEPVLLEERPDAVLVLGDTNSCIAAVMAKRLGIPVFHMEAGNRCFDENVPEETNRRLIDHVADFNLCYTEHARRNLLAEGLSSRRTFVTGSPMAEVLAVYDGQIEASSALEQLGLARGGYYLVSMHREENVDHPERLEILVRAIRELADDAQRVIVSTHPRLARRLENLATEAATGIEFLPPFGYFDYSRLQRNARCVLSDSGTISEESAITGFPAVTIRDAMERPEALDVGSVVLTGIDVASIHTSVAMVVGQWDEGVRPEVPADYRVTDCSVRVSRLICGLSAVHSNWLGLRSKSWRGTGA